ncbi:MAG TPA: ornithine carbamoyltransferase [candidate division Zixibacteria bacterium]|jgi:ornithine carbamoyltransferase|nr:ornithine carbamoyltransferase [Candidatus Latescibacterota bacterium]HIG47151.1 ornithine carbamoyltransferase [candidate division Zixibacteria bacterium]
MTGILKHLVDWKYWSDEDVVRVLDLAQRVKHHRWEYQGHMQGNTLVMIFQKTSTRTRVSFEAGMTELGGHAINLDWNTTNFTLSKIRFEARYLGRNAALIMARLKENADLLEMEKASTVPVINGCCNLYHPCQALADMLTIAEDRPEGIRGARLTYIGVYNNVANSLVSIAAPLGVHLTLVCPIREQGSIDEESRQRLLNEGLLTETLDAKGAVKEADYVYTDTWLDMEYFNDPGYASERDKRCGIMMPYQVNRELLEGCHAKIMHDMPIHPDYEIAEDMIEDESSIIYDQAENRLDAQKAIMLHVHRHMK